MTFDPGSHKPGAADGSMYLQTPGDFVVAFTRYNGRQDNKNGKTFLKMAGVVIHGEPGSVVGKRFTQRVYTTRESYERIGAMCAAMGWDEQFDLESDEDCKRVFLRRPFKAKFKTETRDGKVFASIAFFEQKLTEEESAVMSEWVANAELDPDSDADDAPDVPPPSDDDIPF